MSSEEIRSAGNNKFRLEGRVEKSSRHSKITGVFGENLLLYWLSRSGFESSLVDHTGIDIVAYHKATGKRYGISVKSRSRTEDKASDGMLVKGDNYTKIMESCDYFACDVPSIAFVYDRPSSATGGVMNVYLLSLDTLHKYFPAFRDGKDFTYSISDKYIDRYKSDPSIFKIDFQYEMKDWPN